jgi:tRNA threonylcarbamoyladenosine biosynthesis protein TsaE
MQEIFIENETSMLQFGEQIAKFCRPGAVIFLQGELGAGKTTLVRGILRALNFHGVIKSPTYTLVESYHLAAGPLFHFDLYRLNNPQELLDIGLEDYLQPDAICLIEWPEKALSILPKPSISCTISFPDKGEGRKIIIS